MQNRFNFAERFAPLSSLQGTVLEVEAGRFIIAPANLVSWSLQDAHVVVWYQNDGEDSPRFAQMSDFLTYRQIMAMLLPIDIDGGVSCPSDLLAVLEVAPEEVLVAFATWAGGLHEDRYPNTREVWQWLHHQWGSSRP